VRANLAGGIPVHAVCLPQGLCASAIQILGIWGQIGSGEIYSFCVAFIYAGSGIALSEHPPKRLFTRWQRIQSEASRIEHKEH